MMFGKRKKQESNDYDFDGGFDTDMDMDFNMDDKGSQNTAGNMDFNGFDDFDDLDGNPPNTKHGNGVLKVAGIVAAVLCLLLVGYLIVASILGPTRWQCKRLISDFESSCNTLDIGGMADCIDPQYGKPIKAAWELSKLLTDDEVEVLLDKICRGLNITDLLVEDNGLQDELKTIEIKPERYGLPGRKRVVRCNVSVLGVSKKVYVTIRKKDGDPFIEKIEF